MEEGVVISETENLDIEKLHITSTSGHALTSAAAFLGGGCLFLAFFVWALFAGSFSAIRTNEFLYILVTLGLGSLCVAIGIYSGLVKQHLVVDAEGITYVHKPMRRRILWSDLRKVRILGVNNPDMSAYTIFFDSGEVRINVDSDFDREDLRRVARYLEHLRESHRFEIEDRE
jgi:hypothetical protein